MSSKSCPPIPKDVEVEPGKDKGHLSADCIITFILEKIGVSEKEKNI